LRKQNWATRDLYHEKETIRKQKSKRKQKIWKVSVRPIVGNGKGFD